MVTTSLKLFFPRFWLFGKNKLEELSLPSFFQDSLILASKAKEPVRAYWQDVWKAFLVNSNLWLIYTRVRFCIVTS